MAMAVPSRLWLGGVISAHRDTALIRTLALQIRACALTTTVLVCLDGLRTYVGAIKRAFSDRVLTGKRGRPPRVCPPGLLLAQVVKTSAKRRVVEVSRRVVRGSAAVAAVLTTASGGCHQINTAYIERRWRHLPRLSGPPRAAHPRSGPWRSAAHCRHVPGRHGLHLCVAA